MIPVFSLVLDRDVDENLALLYPELYKELTLGKTLSYKTFFIWVVVSVYQGTRPFLFIPLSYVRLRNHDSQQHLDWNPTKSTPDLRFIHRSRSKRTGYDCSRNKYLAPLYDIF